MGNSFGRNVLGTVGKSIQLSADGKPEMKSGGVTIDWSLFAAHSGADLTLEDGVVITDGEKYIRYGTCIAKVRQAEVQTWDLSGDDDPTGGTWDVDVLGQTLELLAFGISAANLQAALRALPVEFADQITVSKAGFVYTVTFPQEMGNVAAAVGDTTNLTGGVGDTFAITVLTSTQGVTNQGKYGPADTTATDGRQTLVRGSVFLVNETVKESDLHSDHPPALEGGKVWKARILVAGNSPALSAIETAMPRLKYADG